MRHEWVVVIGRCGWTLGVQSLVGFGLAVVGLCLLRLMRRRGDDRRRRRRRGERLRSVALSAATLPAALLATLVCGVAGWTLTGGLWRVDSLAMIAPGVETLLGARATASAWVLLGACRLDAAGRRPTAVRQARRAGRALCGAVLLLLSLGAATALLVPDVGRSIATRGPNTVTLVVAGAVALAVAASAGWLAGLSRKPRPSGYVSIAVYVLGWLLLVAASNPR